MNTEQAKQLSLPDILRKLGHQPAKTTKEGREVWYASPFRTEKDPSFHTSFLGGKWIWKDFGDAGGTVIDFIMRYRNTDVKGALSFLDDLYGVTPIHYSTIKTAKSNPKTELTEEAIFQLDQVYSFGSRAKSILFYITQERGINAEIAKKYLKEVHFKNLQTGKPYFAAGFLNVKNGYEIRNPYFKSTVGEKAISHLQNGSKTVLVFEGFLDFLSYLTDKKQNDTPDDVIILNSISFHVQAAEAIQSKGYTTILTFFDNDRSGNELTNNYADTFKNARFSPQNHLYIAFKDYNEALIAKMQSQKIKSE